MAKLALDDDQRHALAGHLGRMRVAQLVRRKASPHAGLAGDAAQLRARGGGRPGPSALLLADSDQPAVARLGRQAASNADDQFRAVATGTPGDLN